jgi:cold shock CspA family protein
MAKSQETFNKKEKEKKRLQKKKEKAADKEERKANAKKGQSLEDMMAYIDEDGNITNTPPDPSKKRMFNTEDIQIGVARRVEEAEEDTVNTGIVTYFNAAKGYGFIRDVDSKQSVFVHINALTSPVKEGDRVTFDIEKGPKGANAVNVKPA